MLGPVLVGLVMQLLALVGSGSWVHALLVASAFDGWHGLLTGHVFYGPLILRALSASHGWWYAWAPRGCSSAAAISTGTPVARRPGWVVTVRVVVGSAALIAVLAAATSLGPAAITESRLEASMTPTFNSLTLLQQRLLGRSVPSGAKLRRLPTCRRRAGTSQGPDDDWVCTLDVFIPQAGAQPFQLTPVTYDMSVKSNGCYKAEAPPSFVGQQLMRDARGHNVVNPLFTIYGCFDTS